MKLIWTAGADHDRADCVFSIWPNNPSAAERMDQLFDRSVERLRMFPFSAPAGVILGTCELIPHPSYRIVDDTIEILSVFHTSRQWPPEPDQGDR